MQRDCDNEELDRAARTSVALDRLVEIHQLGSLAYYYQGTGNLENEDAISSIILGTSLLTGRDSGGWRIRNQERAGHENYGLLRRRWFLYGILCG